MYLQKKTYKMYKIRYWKRTQLCVDVCIYMFYLYVCIHILYTYINVSKLICKKCIKSYIEMYKNHVYTFIRSVFKVYQLTFVFLLSSLLSSFFVVLFGLLGFFFLHVCILVSLYFCTFVLLWHILRWLQRTRNVTFIRIQVCMEIYEYIQAYTESCTD